MHVEAIGFQRHLDLSAIVTIAPLWAVGDGYGMISTFSVLDNGASAITGGVGEALVATATGFAL